MAQKPYAVGNRPGKRDERRTSDAWRQRVGASIRRAREAQRLTQGELGTACGIDWTTISRIERGESVPDGATLETMADILELSLDELIGREHGHQSIIQTETGPVQIVVAGTGAGKTSVMSLLAALRAAEDRGATFGQIRDVVSLMPNFTPPAVDGEEESRSMEARDPWPAIVLLQQQVDELRDALAQRQSPPAESRPTPRQKGPRSA